MWAAWEPRGLYNICTPTSAPRPGDLVFFVGTYDTAGVSHCGIYVGDGMMIHCGDPIQYANLNTSYWQSHFYAYGRYPDKEVIYGGKQKPKNPAEIDKSRPKSANSRPG